MPIYGINSNLSSSLRQKSWMSTQCIKTDKWVSWKDGLIQWHILCEVHLKRPSINQTPKWQSFTGFHIHQPTRLVWNWITVWGTCANCSELAWNWSLYAVGISAKTSRMVSLCLSPRAPFFFFFYVTVTLNSHKCKKRDDEVMALQKRVHGLTFKWQTLWQRLRVSLTVTPHDPPYPFSVTNHASFRLDTEVSV